MRQPSLAARDMKILFIWDGDYPWDIRVEKVTNALMEDGRHTVHLVARNIARQRRYEVREGLHIHRLPSLPRFLGRLNNPFTFPAFFSPVWLWEIFRQARAHKFQLIIIRDLPLAPAGIFVGKLLGIPTILDMAECYPEMLKNIWKFGKWRPENNVLLNDPEAMIAVSVSLGMVLGSISKLLPPG